MSPSSPIETFGNYRLAERLAFGGMAEVFLATVHGAAGFSKPVVIKRLHPKLNEDSEFVQMLIDEARITAQLIHSNICQVLDLGSVGESYYIAMEFISGEDLRTLQDHCRRRQLELPLEAAVYIATEMLAGLDYAHRKEDADGQLLGIIHRDISPHNVLISYEGEVKVIDFGIAKARSRLVQTEAGIIKGKFRYMAPEQASGGKLDHRTDIFAAAVVLYELLRGGPHSLDLSDTEVLHKMRMAEFEPLQRYRPDLPVELDKIVRKGLQRKPRNRYPSAGEFRQALLRFLQQQGVVYARSELAELMRSVFDEDRRRRRSGSVATAKRAQGAIDEEALPQPRPAESDSRPEPTSMLTNQVSEESARTGIGPQGPAAERLPWEGAVPAGPRSATAPARPRSAAVPAPLKSVVSGEIETGPTFAAAAPEEEAELATHAYHGAISSSEELETRVRQLPSPAAVSAAAAAPQRPASAAPERTSYSPAAAPESLAADPWRTPAAPEPAQGTEGAAPLASHPRRLRGGAGRFSRSERSPYDRPPPRDLSAFPDPPGSPLGPGAGQPHGRGQLSEPPLPAAAPRGPRRRWGSLITVAVVLLLGGALAVGLQLYESGAPGPAPPLPDGGSAGAVDSAGRQAIALLQVQSKPPGAAISYCGQRRPERTPATLEVPAAERCLLELRHPGYQPHRQQISPPASETTTVVASLRRRARGRPVPPRRAPPKQPPTAAADRGTLRVTSIQVGTVYVNNKPLGQTPRLTLQLKPGTYQVWVRFPSLDLTTPAREVFIDPGRTTAVHIDPR